MTTKSQIVTILGTVIIRNKTAIIRKHLGISDHQGEIFRSCTPKSSKTITMLGHGTTIGLLGSKRPV